MKLTQYFPNFPKVVAHRGLSARAPENTLAAFEQAALNHLSWIECDLQLSLDGQVMIFHDEDLSRITGDKSKVRDRTSEELMSIDIGSWFSPSFCDLHCLQFIENVIDVMVLFLGREVSLIDMLKLQPIAGENTYIYFLSFFVKNLHIEILWLLIQ